MLKVASALGSFEFHIEALEVNDMTLDELDRLLDKVSDEFPLARGAILNYALRKFGKDLENIKLVGSKMVIAEGIEDTKKQEEQREYYVMLNGPLFGWNRIDRLYEDKDAEVKDYLHTLEEAKAEVTKQIKSGIGSNNVMIVKKINITMEVEI